jgi:TPR repeat protein
MNIKRVAVVGLGVLLWAAQAMASQWDDQITQWKKESINLKADQIPQLEEAAKNGDVRAAYLLYLETNNARFEYSKRSSVTQLGQWSERIADAGNPIGMRMHCYLLGEGQGGLVKEEVKGVQWCLKATQLGFVDAMVRLGGLYRDGIGVVKNETEAVTWFRKGSELNDGESFGQLGYMYETGTGVVKDELQAAKLYRSAADLGVAWAHNNLGNMYRYGRGFKKDVAEAVKWFLKGADLNDGESSGSLGYMYETGTGVVKNEAQAAIFYKKATEAGVTWANSNLGDMYRYGRGVSRDEAQAVALYRKAADGNYVYGIDNLGVMLRDGLGVSKNETEAVKWFRKGYELNHGASVGNLGYMYETGKGIAKDEAQAVVLYRKAADLGVSWAMSNLGILYQNGKILSKDESEALKWYKKAAEAGDAFAMNSLASMYLDGTGGLPKDDAKAYELYKKSADTGNASGLNAVGWAFANGRGVNKDEKQAVVWYKKAADAGSASAMNSLASRYLEGTGGLPKDDVKAYELFRKSADSGNANGLEWVGWAFANGRGVNKDEKQAVVWYKKSADAGSAGAMTWLGASYLLGLAENKDETKAVEWYVKGVNAGDMDAMADLGALYMHGIGTVKDDIKAVSLTRKAAELGSPIAMSNLGVLYLRGLGGISKDYAKAFEWLRKSSDAGEGQADLALGNMYYDGFGVEKNYSESAKWYVRSLRSKSSSQYFKKGGLESTQLSARNRIDAMLAAGEITDPEVLREVRALSKPAPKAEWVQAPQTTSEEEVTFKFNVVDGGGGIGDVSFKLNGVALNVAQGRNASVIELANTNVRTFTFRLPPGKHDVEVIAYNAENLINWTSLKSTVTSTFKPIRKPQLHAVIVGINEYENDKLKLRFATNDATELAKVLKTSGEKLYDQVHVKLLNTRSSTGKAAILQAIKETASKAQTEDVFIFYVAGHGQNFGDNGYHMLTADVGVMTDKAIQERSISAQELQRAIANVPSGKKVVLLDTCQSGGGLDASKLMSVRGGIDNLDMVRDMNRKSGAIVLAAAESKEDAMEGYQGHGVFTFALLEALQGKADTKGDGFVSTYQLQEYVSDRTYQLAQQAFNGKKQSPYTSGSNGFPFLKWK